MSVVLPLAGNRQATFSFRSLYSNAYFVGLVVDDHAKTHEAAPRTSQACPLRPTLAHSPGPRLDLSIR